MKANTKEMSIRFNLDKLEQRRAYEYLQTMDKQVFRSCNNAICLALIDYFDRYYKVQEDPYLETREREERFTQQIVDAVGESLKQALPLFLAGCMTGLSCSLAALRQSLRLRLRLPLQKKPVNPILKASTGDSSVREDHQDWR